MKTDFVEIFQTIRASLQPYTANGFTAKVNSETNYELWSEKNVDIEGREKDAVFFASVRILKGHVGFYFMPAYVEEEDQSDFSSRSAEIVKGQIVFSHQKIG
ncbi:hypothetical protein [Pedobacter sp. UC225_65]|uniref:hypothetical protein n=1 Tax=Pedobacter sp. UC225_65 TaxID=3350173 RepID=UPI00366E957F